MGTVLRVDYENNAEAWWDAARALGRSAWPASVHDLIFSTRVGEVVVSDTDAHAFLRLAATLPGWNDGPEHAPHAVTAEAQGA